MARWTRLDITDFGTHIDVLEVPYYPQRPNECYVCSIKMVIEYFKNNYDVSFVRENTPALDFDQIADITNTKKLGTRAANLTRDLEKNIPTLKFEMVQNAKFEKLIEHLKKDLPIIVIYNGDYLKNEEKGGAHAGVVVGVNESVIVLNNPWFGYQSVFDKIEFEHAWEIEYKTAILITPKEHIDALQTQISQGGRDART